MRRTLRNVNESHIAPKPEEFEEAIKHIERSASNDEIVIPIANGLTYSLIETLGVMLGDPDLPDHIRSGYEGLREMALEVEKKILSIG